MRNKQMVYTIKVFPHFIATGSYDGFRYYVKNIGTHPCCYVAIPEECSITFSKEHRDLLQDTISCHGGLTYIEKLLWDSENEQYIPGKFIGWDYAHACDYIAGDIGHDGIKYDTDFLVKECFDVIEQLQSLEKRVEKSSDYIKVIAVDFDGVICESNYPYIGKPNQDIINAIKYEKALGTKIILWTCRCDKYLEEAIEACTNWGLEFDAVNDNIQDLKDIFNNNCRKVSATEYWDDRNITVEQIRDKYCI